MKVLVSDSLSEVGIKIFRETPGITVDVNTGLTPEELRGIIDQYQGLVIRSSTKVTAQIIEAARNLKVIGRAGIGLDNVDIPAANNLVSPYTENQAPIAAKPNAANATNMIKNKFLFIV